MQYFMAIDIGTTNLKVVAFSPSLQLLDKLLCANAAVWAAGRKREQSPDTLLTDLHGLVRQMINKYGQPMGVAFSSAMHALLLVDAAFQPISDFWIWSDTRAVKIVEKWKNTDTGYAFYESSGTPVHPMSPLLKIKYLSEEQPSLLQKAAYLLDIKSYVLAHWFGEAILDYSVASGTGMMDGRSLAWSEAALSWLQIEHSQLPRLVDTRQLLFGLKPNVQEVTGLDKHIPVVAGGADGPLANYGAEIDDTKYPVMTIGTSGAVRIRKSEFEVAENQALFCYYLKKGNYVIGGASNNGGNVFAWLKNLMGENIDYEQILANGEPGARGLLFLPYLNGERAPFWDAGIEATFIGINSQHGQQEFIRAVMEGVMLHHTWMLEALEAQSSQVFERFYVSGGFTASAAWVQMLSDMSEKELLVGQSEEASARGAARIGLEAIGVLEEVQQSTAELQKVMPNRTKAEAYRSLKWKFKEKVNQKSRKNRN